MIQVCSSDLTLSFLRRSLKIVQTLHDDNLDYGLVSVHISFCDLHQFPRSTGEFKGETESFVAPWSECVSEHLVLFMSENKSKVQGFIELLAPGG